MVMPPEMLQAFDSHAFRRLKPCQRVRTWWCNCSRHRTHWRTGCRCASLAVMLGASVGRDVVDAGHATVRQETAALRDFSPSMSGLGHSRLWLLRFI